MPVFDAHSTAKGTASSLTFSHTCTGADRYLKVAVGVNFTDNDVTGVTYNGVALTLLSALENVMRDEFWYLIAPAAGTFNIVVTFAGATREKVCHGDSYTDVHQTTPHGTVATAFANSTTPSVAVSSAAGELVVDALAAKESDAPATLTVHASQTQRGNDSANAANAVFGATSEEAGAASVTMSWTLSSTNDWATIGVSLKPAGTAHALAAVIAASATLAAALPVARALVGVVNASATVAINLPVEYAFLLQVNGTSTLAGAMPVAKPLAGVVTAASTVSGALPVAKPLAGIVNAVSTVVGDATAIGPPTTAVDADGALRDQRSGAYAPMYIDFARRRPGRSGRR